MVSGGVTKAQTSALSGHERLGRLEALLEERRPAPGTARGRPISRVTKASGEAIRSGYDR